MNEVYIDGCNVAECEHLLSDGKRKPICKSGGSCRVYKSCLCVDNSDCHFKQLQRAKAENEKLKIRNIELEAYFKVNEDFQKAWQELNSMHNNLQQVYQDEHCDNLKYKQALEEVKKLAELEVIIFDNNSLFPTNIQRIIDKINNALND